MGKKLVILGADFSANAIESLVPSTFDYEIIGFLNPQSASQIQALPVGSYWVEIDSLALKHKADSGYVAEEIIKTDGLILKLSNNLFAVWNANIQEFSYRTENEEEVPFTFLPKQYYKYTSPNTFELTSNAGVDCASLSVNVGDVIIYSGKGGSASRSLAISNNSELEFITAPSLTLSKNVVYEVKTNGTLYFNSANNVDYSLTVLR